MEFMETIAAAMNLYTAASAVPGRIRSQAVPRELSERRQEVVVPRLRCSLSRCVFELWVLFVRVGVAEGGWFLGLLPRCGASFAGFGTCKDGVDELHLCWCRCVGHFWEDVVRVGVGILTTWGGWGSSVPVPGP